MTWNDWEEAVPVSPALSDQLPAMNWIVTGPGWKLPVKKYRYVSDVLLEATSSGLDSDRHARGPGAAQRELGADQARRVDRAAVDQRVVDVDVREALARGDRQRLGRHGRAGGVAGPVGPAPRREVDRHAVADGQSAAGQDELVDARRGLGGGRADRHRRSGRRRGPRGDRRDREGARGDRVRIEGQRGAEGDVDVEVAAAVLLDRQALVGEVGYRGAGAIQVVERAADKVQGQPARAEGAVVPEAERVGIARLADQDRRLGVVQRERPVGRVGDRHGELGRQGGHRREVERGGVGRQGERDVEVAAVVECAGVGQRAGRRAGQRRGQLLDREREGRRQVAVTRGGQDRRRG